MLASVYEQDYVTVPWPRRAGPVSVEDIPTQIKKLKKEMQAAAKKLDFERAATLRDQIRALEVGQLKYA